MERWDFMDIKETKEALVGLNEVSLLLAKHLKDGLQLSQDISAVVGELLANPELKDKLAEAAKGIQQVPAELSNLSMSEGVQLVMVQVDYLPKLIEAFKK
jgi:hypothetical protein